VLPDGTTRLSTVLRGVLVIVIALWLIVPLLVVVGLSFTGQQSFAFPPSSWSLDWYRSLSSPALLDAFYNSVIIATFTAIGAVLIGTPASLAIVRSRSRWVRSLRTFVLAPQVMPVLIVALGVYLLFLRWSLVGTHRGFVVIYVALALPFVVIPVSATLETFDRALEQASASLGAGQVATFRQITFPIIRPSVLGGAMIAFLSAFDEAVIGLYLSTPNMSTLPVVIFRSMTDQTDPTVAAVAATEITLVTVGVVIAVVNQRRRRRILKGNNE
jgi:putative spermidine/putrescine transport system permease protein